MCAGARRCSQLESTGSEWAVLLCTGSDLCPTRGGRGGECGTVAEGLGERRCRASATGVRVHRADAAILPTIQESRSRLAERAQQTAAASSGSKRAESGRLARAKSQRQHAVTGLASQNTHG